MASNQHTGINPLNIPRVDATQSGINSAFATISREIAERTPRESLSTGSLQTGSGKFSVPATPSEQVRPRHAFHTVVYMDAAASSTVKANFQAAYVIEQDDTQFPVFATEADQTVAIADGEKYWVKILVNNDYEVQSASFIQAATTTDVDPSPTANGEIYKLCVEFDEDAAGKLVVTYHRFDSINYRPASTSSSHPWKVTDEGSGTVAIAAGYITGYYLYYPDSNPNTAPSGGPGNYGPDAITLGPASTYSGSAGNAVTGTKYIYAESPRNGATKSNEYSETYFTGTPNVLIELFDDIKPVSSDTAAIVISSDAPDSYHSAATSPTKAAVCLAKVVNTAGVIAVTTYITHNPTIFLPTPQVNTAV